MKAHGDGFRVENSAESSEWPIPVKKALLALVATAVENDFSILAAVGLNMKAARDGQMILSAMMSPNASSNPHRGELCDDVAKMFQRMAERSKQ